MVIRVSDSEHASSAGDGRGLIEESLVSPMRLGRVLEERRLAAGLNLAEVAWRSSRQFTAEDLGAFESGRRAPSDSEALLLQSIYAPDETAVLPTRMRLVLDLDERVVRVGSHRERIGRRSSTKPDRVLARYLKLVYAMRSKRSGTRVPLRDDDLSTLSEALGIGEDQIRDQLHSLMERTDWSDQLLTRKVVFPALGAVVATTAMGRLVLVPDDGPTDSESLTAIQIDVPTADQTARQTAHQTVSGAPDSNGIDAATPETVAPPQVSSNSVVAAEAQVSSTSTTNVAPPADDTQDAPNPTAPANAEGSEPAPSEGAPSQPAAADNGEALAATADAPAPPTPELPRSAQVGAEALELISYDWESILPGWTVDFEQAADGYLGGTFPQEKRIALYVRDNHTAHDLAITLAHELGHAVDVELNTQEERNAWRDARGLDDRAWFGEPGASDFATPSGDFAEAFAAWQVDSSDFRSELGEPPTAEQIALLQQLSLR